MLYKKKKFISYELFLFVCQKLFHISSLSCSSSNAPIVKLEHRIVWFKNCNWPNLAICSFISQILYIEKKPNPKKLYFLQRFKKTKRSKHLISGNQFEIGHMAIQLTWTFLFLDISQSQGQVYFRFHTSMFLYNAKTLIISCLEDAGYFLRRYQPGDIMRDVS